MPNSAFLLAALAPALLATETPGVHVRTFPSPLDGAAVPYALYIPRGYDPQRKYPLVVALHGEGSNHRLMLRRVFGRPSRAGETGLEAAYLMPPLPDVDFVVACPFAREANGYQGFVENDVYAMLDDLARRVPIDENRVYLTGQGLGGGGALRLALVQPARWAAVVAICPIPPPGLEPLARNALNLPIRLVHGTLDSLAPVEISQEWKERLLALGGTVFYDEIQGGKHNVWDLAYRGARIFDWFSAFRRNPFPDRVRLVSEAGAPVSAYWLSLRGEEADAVFTAPNRVEISTKKVVEVSLRPEGHPRYDPSRPLLAVLDGVEFPLRPPFRIVRQGPYRVPSEGGPLWRVFAARHIYVYGTLNATGEEIARRRHQAEQAARWSATVRLPVKADRETSAADLRDASLVLFGTPQTNSVLAGLSSSLPLTLNVSAADMPSSSPASTRRSTGSPLSTSSCSAAPTAASSPRAGSTSTGASRKMPQTSCAEAAP
jgi:poly(3-hydroxybutyrate) depolymerase